MPRLIIQGGYPIKGEVAARGAKNAALPLMAACLLVKDDVVLKRIPNISDVFIMADLLRALGAKVDHNQQAGELLINCSNVNTTSAPYKLVRKIHASFDVTGPLLARFQQAEVPLPGGCVLGTRAVNFHIEGFQALGAQVNLHHGVIKAKTQGLRGTKFFLKRPSVGATKNLVMAACMAKGLTTLENVARDPEVDDLVNFLNRCGGDIQGLGETRLVIKGVNKLHGVEYPIISDRIEAGTYLMAAAATGGWLTVTEIDSRFLESLLSVLNAAGQRVESGENHVKVVSRRPLKAVEITTAPFPGFPTDLQPPLVASLTLAQGISVVEETIFDGRFGYVDELRRMGADIRVTDHTAVVHGVGRLTGAPLEALDIRGGGAMVLAGLAAVDKTEISGVEFIDRGYERIEESLAALGARIRRVN